MTNARLRAWIGDARALLPRLRGARLGPKCRVDRLLYIERPAWLSGGGRVHIEQNAAIKIVTSGASVRLGEQLFIGRNSTLDVNCSLVVGDRTLIAPGCFITEHNHGIGEGQRIVEQGVEIRPVVIGADAWIGANVCILPGFASAPAACLRRVRW